LRRLGEDLVLSIVDNGAGYDTAAFAHVAAFPSGTPIPGAPPASLTIGGNRKRIFREPQ
jgi:hypothetical protein